MVRPTAFRWISTGLLAALFVAGCNSAQRQPARMSNRSMPVSQVYPAYPQNTVVTQLPDAQVVVPPEKVTPASLPAAAPVKTETEMQPAAYTPPAPKEDVKRRSYTDVTADPGFAHADNYGWLKGRLEILHMHGEPVYRLRYASVDEEDKYGGGVNLVDMSRNANFSSGQMVRVEGEVLEPDAREVGSQSFRYKVRNIEAVNP